LLSRLPGIRPSGRHNGGVPETTRFRRRLALPAVVATLAVALAGCSDSGNGGDGGGDDGGDAAEAATPTPTPSPTVDLPEGVELTEPGAQLGFGDRATVAHEAGGETGLLTMRVDSATRGALEDFAGFELDDPYKKRGNYYYVRVTVENAGEEPFGGVAVPLWGISGDNTLLQAVQFTSVFKKCPTEELPAGFRPGDRFKTCLVYLSPNRGSLEGVSYRPSEDDVPIEWRGEVTVPKEKRGKGKARGR
jgi:hypothetical protein